MGTIAYTRPAGILALPVPGHATWGRTTGKFGIATIVLYRRGKGRQGYRSNTYRYRPAVTPEPAAIVARPNIVGTAGSGPVG
jgi:hypothetical protein